MNAAQLSASKRMAPADGTSGSVDVTAAIEVREAVARRLLEAGWQRLAPDPVGPVDSGGFSIAVGREFSVTVWVLPWVGGALHELPQLFVAGLAGLDYLPARKITTALVGRSYSGVTFKDPRRLFSLARGPDADRAADALTRFASDVQVELRKDADIDTVVAMLGGGAGLVATRPTAVLDEPPAKQGEDHSLVVAAILATSGRFDRARRELSALALAPEDLAACRASRQLARWIETKGTLTLPASPAQWGLPRQSRRAPEASRRWSEHRQLAITRRQAMDSVGPLCRGKSRNEIRAMLEAEFQRRYLRTAPESLERDVDVLFTEQQPFGKLRLATRGIKGLAGFISDSRTEGGGLARALTDAAVGEEENALEQRKLPERAAYPIYATGDQRVAVKLDASATRILDELTANLSPGEGSVPIRLWFTRSLSTSGLDVHARDERIGTLQADTGKCLEPAMSAADERDEAPWSDARLIARREEPIYLVELALPTEELTSVGSLRS